MTGAIWNVVNGECRLMALFGRASRANQCPVSGVKQPCRRNPETAEFDVVDGARSQQRGAIW
jgi:hypothetical protein